MSNLELVAAELEAAKKKHQHFVDHFTKLSPSVTDSMLSAQRKVLADYIEWKTCDFISVLDCEILEAASAYAHGDLAHARQELAQCAAVCIRAMEYVEKKMEETK